MVDLLEGINYPLEFFLSEWYLGNLLGFLALDSDCDHVRSRSFFNEVVYLAEVLFVSCLKLVIFVIPVEVNMVRVHSRNVLNVVVCLCYLRHGLVL